ncbi:hypothetical protein BC830DRAFT_1156910 [Chytriomyces sp. MP71]|nr:hypothetical protein BC830DRAFT_1156910 [Chytriomyces sp. MP71]
METIATRMVTLVQQLADQKRDLDELNGAIKKGMADGTATGLLETLLQHSTVEFTALKDVELALINERTVEFKARKDLELARINERTAIITERTALTTERMAELKARKDIELALITERTMESKARQDIELALITKRTALVAEKTANKVADRRASAKTDATEALVSEVSDTRNTLKVVTTKMASTKHKPKREASLLRNVLTKEAQAAGQAVEESMTDQSQHQILSEVKER